MRSWTWARARWLAGCALCAVVGCTSQGGAAPVDAADESSVGCLNDVRADVWTPGLHKKGVTGTFTFVLVSADPAPPARGSDSWTVRVEDAQGKALVMADVKVKLVMPDHGHGTSVVPTITPMGDNFVIAPLYFFMPGLWQVTITATVGSTADSASFTFCIAG